MAKNIQLYAGTKIDYFQLVFISLECYHFNLQWYLALRNLKSHQLSREVTCSPNHLPPHATHTQSLYKVQQAQSANPFPQCKIPVQSHTDDSCPSNHLHQPPNPRLPPRFPDTQTPSPCQLRMCKEDTNIVFCYLAHLMKQKAVIVKRMVSSFHNGNKNHCCWCTPTV